MTIAIPVDADHLKYYAVGFYLLLCLIKHWIDIFRVKAFNRTQTVDDNKISPFLILPLFLYNMTICIPLNILLKVIIIPVIGLIALNMPKFELPFFVDPPGYRGEGRGRTPVTQDSISITINFSKVAWTAYLVTKIALAIYLQRCYLQCFGPECPIKPRLIDLWASFIVNLLSALEWALIQVLLYPIKIIVIGKMICFTRGI